MDGCVYFFCSYGSGVGNILDEVSISTKRIYVNRNFDPEINYDSDVIVYHYDQHEKYHIRILTKLRTLYPDTPIIITTRKQNADIAVWALRCNITDFILVPDELQYLYQRIYNFFRAKNPLGRTVAVSVVENDHKQPLQTPKKTTNNKLSIAVAYITQYYWKKISINELAGVCHMSTQSFSRRFKREYGVTVREYIKCYRISIAAKLLCDDTISIQQVAYKSGFDDPSHFNRIFKSIERVTPSKYRANHNLKT